MNLPSFCYAKYHRLSGLQLLQIPFGGLLILLISGLALSACSSLHAGSRMQHPDDASIIDLPVVKPDQTESLSQVMKQLDDARVVLVGESHTRYDHHLVQLEVLKYYLRKKERAV